MVGRVFLGRYETMRLLGEGGMGAVYLARDTERDEPVVVKVMHQQVATSPKFRERFEREVDLMARLEHPNTVTFLDASLDDPSGPCIIMEFLPGITLDKLLARNGRFSPARLRRLLAQFCDVLQAAHDLGIIHRDLKPVNLMVLDPDTPFEKLKVMDFGLAQMAEEGAGAGEYAVGTAGYMPPEQVSGKAMDHRGDLYSLGVIVYQMLTGQLPFGGESMMEILMAQATEGPPTFASLGLADRIPPAVEELVRSCLAADPAQRPASARAIGDGYEGALALAYTRREEPPPEPPPAPPTLQPDTYVERLEAWMPEQIAVFKLRAFVEEVEGTIVENSPGKVRVTLTVGPAAKGGGLFGWLSRSGRPCALEMELIMDRKDPSRPNLLFITVRLRPTQRAAPADWKDRCAKVYGALRSYLMSKG
jgi:serine/threonine-protein kinase